MVSSNTLKDSPLSSETENFIPSLFGLNNRLALFNFTEVVHYTKHFVSTHSTELNMYCLVAFQVITYLHVKLPYRWPTWERFTVIEWGVGAETDLVDQ